MTTDTPFAPSSDVPRLAQVLAGESWGGAERFFVKFCAALQARGWAQRAIVSPEPQRVRELRAAGCDVATIAFRRGLFGLLDRPALRRALTDFGAEVAHCTLKRAVMILPDGPWAATARIGGYYEVGKYRRCDLLVAITPDLVRHLRDGGWPAERVAMIPSFGGLPPAPPLAREAFGDPSGRRIVLGIGRLHPVKGFDVLIRAMARVPDAALWLAGDGPLRADLEALAAAEGVADRVRFLGWRHDQAALYAAADVVAMPSSYEPFGLVVLEAWSAGTPLVACAAQGPSWLIRDGEDGLLCPIGDADALAAQLRAVLDDAAAAAALADAARRRWKADFSEDAVCAQYADAFRRAIRLKRETIR
jgi:glycosyltransferase involved in cell wall biosynthesis